MGINILGRQRASMGVWFDDMAIHSREHSEQLTHISLFSGGGGELIASQWLHGWRTVCYVEYHQPAAENIIRRIREGFLDDAPVWDDVRTFNGRAWRGVDIVTGGFPCQPFSVAGKQLGIADPRNMWPDTIRCIREIRPRYVLLENVPGLKSGQKSASKFNGLSVRSLGKHGVVKSNLSSSLPTSGEYSQTWPKAGLMLNGVCYPQPKLELRINEIGYGLLPTVTANKQTSNTADPADMVCKDGSPWVPGKKPYDRRTGKPVTTTLHDFLRFPAPNTMDALPPKSAAALEREATVSRPGRTRPANLRDAVGNSENLPAPRANERGDYQYDQGDKTKPRPRLTLSGAVKLTNLPTPKTNNDRKIAKERNRPEGSGFDEKMSSIESNSIGCYLSPDWVEWLMGWPIRWTAETCTVENFVAWLQGMVTGTWWLTEPEGVPRTISQGENRVERIRMLGNGQVPLQAAVAVHLLAGEPKHD